MIRDDVKIELEDIGEGEDGDYDENDADDTPLLRFSCYVKGALRQEYLDKNKYGLDDQTPPDYPDDALLHPDGWVAVANASYCTRLPATLSAEDQARAEAVLMDKLYGPITGLSAKRPAEEASWIEPSWLKEGSTT